MGKQQLLLIVLGVAVAALAIVVGITLWLDAAQQSNRSAVVKDLQYLASGLLEAYKTPLLQTGLEGDYRNLFKKEVPEKLKKNRRSRPWKPTQEAGFYWQNQNGKYTFVTVTKDSVVLKGLGVETGIDGDDPVTVMAYIGPTDFRTEIIN